MKIWKILLIILAAVFICGALGWLTNGFQSTDGIGDKFSPKVNEDNLYTAEALALSDKNDGSGIVVDVDEKTGAVHVKGTADVDKEYVIGKVTLNEGTYTITALDGAALAKAYVKVMVNGVDSYADFTGNQLTITEDATVATITLVVKEGTTIDADVLPVIVEGTEPGKFWA